MKFYFDYKKKKQKESEKLGRKTYVLFILDFWEVLFISLAIIIPVRYFLIQPFVVKGASMEPNFHNHDYLIVDQISYRFKNPQRGDIVVFRYPKEPREFFIKRIIGVPGDLVEIKNGKVYINGKVLDESVYLGDNVITKGSVSVLLNDDEYYVLGDNRPFSLDSRSFGPVNRKFIIGKVWIRGWPFNKIDIFDSLKYNVSE